MPILIADDSVIKNPKFAPIFVPFNTVDGCLAAWRGDFASDLTGNGNTLTKVGSPNQARFAVSGNKSNGYRTSVKDGINRTLIGIHRQPSPVGAPGQAYNYPIGNLSQSATNTGVGIGIIQANAVSSNINQISGVVGASKKDDPYFARAAPPATPASDGLEWQWSALVVDGSNNFAALYIPSQSGELVMAEKVVGVNLANRWVTNTDGSPSYYNICAWRDPSTPVAESSTIEVASSAFFDKPLLLSDLNMMYQYDKFFMAQHGEVI